MGYKIAFIGACFPDVILNKLIDKGEIADVPANVFGWKFVESLVNNGQNVTVINEHKRPKFPKGPLIVPNKIYDDYKIVGYSYLNIKYADKIEKQHKIYIELAKCKPELIIVYSLHSPYLRPALKYAKKYRIKIIAVVPDLPQYMFGKRNGIEKRLKEWDCKVILNMLREVDGFILLTKQMKDALGISAPYEVIEGIANKRKTDGVEKEKDRGNYILYSGALSEKYGLDTLLHAYLSIDTDVELWLCGQGNYENKLKEIAGQNSRIKYLGLLNRNKLTYLQKKARLLVNPRNSEEKYTMYSFPSKTMEYLQSGTPVMMERLLGIPDEYYKYIIEVKNHDWENALKEWLSTPLDCINEIGERGQLFVQNNKNAFVQGKKVIDFIDSIN